MEDYQKVYYKLFNAMTDLAADAKDIVKRMEKAQQECEELILNDSADEGSGAV